MIDVTARWFPIICVGGAGSRIESYTDLIGNLTQDLGAAVLVINYMKNFATLLHETLPHWTAMPVELISEGRLVNPNHVYIVDEEREVHVLGGKFCLMPISKRTGWPDVVTVTLISLARHWHGRVIAVILSGYDGDGADALRLVKEVGGSTFAQEASSSEQPDMPNSAIASGYVDFILKAEDIAKEINRIIQEDGISNPSMEMHVI